MLTISFFFRVSVPGHQGALGVVMAHESLAAWQVFAVEFVLTFLIVFTVYSTMDPNRRCFGSDSLAVGIAYLACTITGVKKEKEITSSIFDDFYFFDWSRFFHFLIFFSSGHHQLPSSGASLNPARALGPAFVMNRWKHHWVSLQKMLKSIDFDRLMKMFRVKLIRIFRILTISTLDALPFLLLLSDFISLS